MKIVLIVGACLEFIQAASLACALRSQGGGDEVWGHIGQPVGAATKRSGRVRTRINGDSRRQS